MTETVKKLAAPYMTLPPAKRWLVGVVAVLSILAFGVLISVSNRIDYKPLFSNLGNEDAGEIMKKLKEQKVPSRISDDGKAILVPADKVYELRMSLASEGLAPGERHRFRNIRPEELRHDRIRAETELPARPAGRIVAHDRPD